jgi:HlyD family secretion protein
MQKKLILIIVAIGVLGAGAWAYTKYKGTDAKPQIVKAAVTRGNIIEAVQATGTLEAWTTVQVGTQVSGTVQALYADFNHIVKKGQVIARLDPSLLQTQIEQQEANVTRAEADLERLRVGLQDAKVKLARAQELEKRQLIPRTELEASEMAVKSQEASIRSSEAGLTQAKANLNQAKVNLGHTVITAPIDGIVISRNVDEGQTVAASMNAPVLYLLAADLTKMKVKASIDEAEIGKIRPGQRVTFRVDAFPTGQFEGTVLQVQLSPVVTQNVVTYAVVIDVPNPDMRLKPGMTANVNVEIARRDNVLRVPAGALRFRATTEIFEALKQEPPADLTQGFGRGRGQNGQGGQGQTGQAAPPAQGGNAAQPNAQSGSQPSQGGSAQPNAQQNARQGGAASGNRQGQTAENRGGGDNRGGNAGQGGEGRRGGFDPNMTPEERQRRMQERMANMTPEERQAFQQRMARGGQGGGRGQGAGGNTTGGNARTNNQGGGRGQGAGSAAPAGGAPQTVDALFAPLPVTTQRGRVWMVSGTELQPQLKSINVRTGVNDGQWAELIEGELTEGQEVVTGVILPNAQTAVPGTTGGNPLMGPQRGQQPNRGGGGNQGGGAGRGR